MCISFSFIERRFLILCAGRTEKMSFWLLGKKHELNSLLYCMSPSLFHRLTLVSKVIKKFISVFGEQNANTQYVPSLCQQSNTPIFLKHPIKKPRRSRWLRGLRRRSAAARLLGLLVRIPPGEWMPVCCECCLLPFRSLCDGLIILPEESYRVCCV